ncbi:bromodomain adjacent to zinc finger domain protein 1A [Anopheles darlingi]|uniref:bromodomain adjacent to zinc finger domain protein 1A n=1 Tax=Anopheles darlingi TaxID=43151 RepID=UPI00210014DC|nr:bromodomain adjacent to zinc finger domain protein 1A [Anopheles darlingi]XP_049541349.1 bromodomain adjacent to zinc finger domain protein 1A [Anopheles darlingi]XP_049541358.1 bromodomain adjacent to zinc finger domain protein 1A [Anopheles darlingi]XP_049541366.1 bromodomain adjacent to zinc finger domain protein 1A [Anopheles darlingi]XP_049541374.1 bromodomain adjacent to zinc finger domain protein 1A [Anopheles darlingi]
MPLLRRQVFQKAAGTERLRDSDEVFFCEPTGEIFSSYEDYFHRVMLISSIVWSCALTGRPNLTYAEALESEKAARKLLKTFPDALKGPFLLVASHTKRTSINEMHEDVYSYIKDQLFKGEVVDALDPSGKTYRRAKIVAVTLHSNSPSKQNGDLTVGNPSAATGAPIMVYTMASNDGKGPETWITLPAAVKRDRSSITRDKCKLFLKQHVEAGPGGILRIKESSLRQYVEAQGWTNDQVFFGNVPDFELSKKRKDKEVRNANKELSGADVMLVESTGDREVTSKGVSSSKQQQASKGVKRKKVTKNVANSKGAGSRKDKQSGPKQGSGKGQQQMNITKYLDAQSLEAAAEAKAKSMTEELERLKARAAADAAAKKRLEEEKALLTQQTTLAIKRYNLVLDDLELTDQRVLPVPRPVSTLIEPHHFSDFVFILEFMNSFADLLSIRNKFPNGMTMELLERALLQREVNGPLGDILQVLLSTIFAQQAEEENEVDVRYDRPENIAQKRLTVPEQARARDTAVWIEKHFSTPLNELPMDSTTISELLRLHFLSSGALVEEKAAKHRYCNRGGYSSADDPGLRLVQDFPHIFRALRSYPVYQLPVGDVIQLLCCLIHQLLTYNAVRELVEERIEHARITRINFQSARVAQRRLTLKTGSMKYLAREEFKKELAAFQGSEQEREEFRKQLQEKLEEQVARIDAEAQQKLKLLHQQSEKLKEDFFDYQIYLGTDRSFRNYWLFESLPGLFVQHDRTLAGRCLDRLTPNIPALANCATEQRRKFITKCIMQNGQQQQHQQISSEPGEEIYEELLIRGSAALEEISRRGATAASNTAIVPTAAAGTAADEAMANDVASEATPVIVIDLDSPDEEATPAIKPTLPVTASSSDPPTNAQLMMCTTDTRTCPVHGQPGDGHAGPSWGYFATADELDALIRSLNVRGLREKQLRETLDCERDLILSHIVNCPLEKLSIERQNRLALLAELVTRHQKRYDAPNFNYPPGTEPNEIMEAVFRDNLLELEAKITVGYLGVMKVRDREAWRKAIQSNGYDPQADEPLQWGQKRLLAVTNNAVAKASGGGGGGDESQVKEEPMADVVGGASSPSHKNGDEGGQQGRGSDDESDDEMERLLSNARDPGYNLPEGPPPTWSMAPVSTLDDSCTFPLHESETLHRSVHTLARALLQIEQCIEQKFLRHPFGPKKDHKDRTVMLQKQTQGLKNLVKWEVSLMRSTSFAQLFLHYNVLYDAIYWSRSAERISCMICRRKVDPDLTLLCDECNRACHIYCLKPKLKEVPAGDWFCMKCRPENFKAKQGPAKKKKPIFQWEDRMDEEKEDESLAEEEDEEGSLGGGTADQYMDSDEEYAVGKVAKQPGGTKAATTTAAGAKLAPTSKATTTTKVTTTRNSRSAAAAAAAAAAANGGTATTLGKQHHYNHQQHANDDGFDEDYEEQEEEEEGDRSANGEERESTVERATTPNEERRESRRRVATVVTSGTKRKTLQKEVDSGRDVSSSKRPRRSATKRSTSLTNTIKISPKMVKTTATSGGGSKRHREDDDDDDEEDDDDYELGDSENEPLVTRVSTRNSNNRARPRRSSLLNGTDRNGSVTDELEGGAGGGSGSRRSRRTADDLPLNSVALYTLIDDILKHPNSWPFNRPVSAKEVPDYYSVIKTPMDFARIKSKLNMGDYKINEQMLSDVQLVFRNCDLYNTDETDVYRIGRDLERYVVKRCKELALPFQPSDMQKSTAYAASSPANGTLSSARNLNGSAVQSPSHRHSIGGGEIRR